MAIINSYQVKNKPNGSDIIIGTSVENGATKNFSISSISFAAVDSYLATNSFEFVIEPDVFENRPVGSISFENYEGDLTSFSNISNLYVNTLMPNGSYSINYLTRLIGKNITISDKRDLDRYGVYSLQALTLIEDNIYRMDLGFLEGSSSIHNLHYYGISFNAESGSDKTFEYIQPVPYETWNIAHGLNKFPSVSVVNNNNIIMYGEVTYIDRNNLTISFSAGFSGKAYLN